MNELREVFPGLKASVPWNESAITAERNVVSKDPSVAAVGLHGNVLGSRIDLLVIDDVQDFESSRTSTGRDTAHDWIVSTIFSRLTSKARVVLACTPWDREDTAARLEAQGWPTYRFAVENADGEPNWPERWSPERIAQTRLALGAVQAARQLDVQCRADGASAFEEAWLALALRRGATEALKLQRNTRGEPYLLNRPTWPARLKTPLLQVRSGKTRSS